jgi:hypothetical protein
MKAKKLLRLLQDLVLSGSSPAARPRFGTPPPNTFVWYDYGEVELLKNAIYRNFQTDWKMRLYQNNYTPAPTDNGSSIVECTWLGYAPTVVGAWGTPATVASIAQSSAGIQTVTASGSLVTAQTVYGWYLTHTSDADAILGACLLGASVVVNTPSQVLQITPTITLRTLGS